MRSRGVSARVSLPLKCPTCDAKGTAVWLSRPRGPREVESIKGPFHVERGRTRADDVLIVCDKCDEILV